MSELIESYLNGNKDYVFKQYQKMNPLHKQEFIEEIFHFYDKDEALSIYRSLLIRLI